MDFFEYNKHCQQTKGVFTMSKKDNGVMAQEMKLIHEMGNMKFSFKKLLKAIELTAYTCSNR